ncbi:MAG: TonB-dependent siderophore receptor [Hyphomicrobiaceae bacterium]|nr:TonB-dependent siderophore receptor [Hyphomicrobiaceae bacterium]
MTFQYFAASISRAALLATCAALVVPVTLSEARAQQAATPAPLPQITVEAAKKKKPATAAKKKSAPVVAKKASPPPVAAEPEPAAPVNEAAGTGPGTPDAQGDIGYNATRTSTATKTETPLRNVPQSISVITDKQIKDQNIKSISEAVKYVPGVSAGQGEGNRDTVIIRGQNTTADFFVDGIRDDAQIYRDFYNSERLEVLKGPNALIFGRGGGGGVVNRVTKQADFFTLREGTVSVGSFDYKRASADVNAAVNRNFAVRLNAMYEDSGSYRDGVDLERWGVNPTITFRPTEKTRVVLGYEHFEDRRTADRGIPSILVPAGRNSKPAPTSRSTFFGNPELSYADGRFDQVYAIIEHKTDIGLNIRNHTRYTNYDKFYQNVFASTAANLATDRVTLDAYNNENDRENFFNTTDLTYKLDHGVVRQTLLAGFEYGHQNSMGRRFEGAFGPTSDCLAFPSGNCSVRFSSPQISGDGITFPGAPSTDTRSTLDVWSAYVQDQIEITRYLEVIGGVRFDQFDLQTSDLVTNVDRDRVDEVWSPRAGVVLKPTDYLSIYGSYTVSHLPFSGDQFTGLNGLTLRAQPEKFTNYEVGAKYDVTPSLSLAVAHYWLTRENSRFTIGNAANDVVQTGETKVEGTEVTLNGYVTDKWQIAGGYAHQEGEVSSATSVVEGTELPNLPRHTFSLWNRYDFSSMWGAGVGVVHRTDIIAALANDGAQVILPEYTTVDAALYFKLNENLRAQLNVENIFNEKYFANAHNNNNIQPGPPTAAYLSITSNF